MNEFFNTWSLIIQFINILIILYLLNRFLFKPYLAYLDKEVEERKEFEAKAKNIDTILSDAENKAKSIVNDAKTKAVWIKDKAVLLGKDEAEVIKTKAKDEADKIKAKWLLDVEEERKNLHAWLKNEAVSLAIRLNKKLFTESKNNEDFIVKSLNS